MNEDLQQTVVWDNGQDSRNVAVMFAVSALCHVAFFVLITVMPASFSSSYGLAPQAISVDLVSLPPGPPAAAAPAPVTPTSDTTPEPEPEMAPPAPAPEPVPLPVPEPEPVSIAPKPKPENVVKSLKKKTIKKETLEKTVVQKPAPPEASKTRSRDVSKAIEAMREKVQTQEKTRAAAGAGAATGTGTGGGGGGGGGGSAVLSRIENYKIETALAVAQNWAFSQQLAGAGDQLETRITFRILPNGEITDIKIVQPSGNRYLDESAYRAVRKASPVAPHPEGINQPYIEMGVKATPSGFR
jgi:colicin import membrane protein